jgi:hypothetical protein
MQPPHPRSLRANGLAQKASAACEGTHVAARGRHQPALRPTHPHTADPVGSLFSQISGKFSKSLVFGCFFPVVFFVLLDWILFAPYMPPARGLVKSLTALEKEWQTLAVGGLTVLFSGLLYLLNTPIVRFYEGYPWQHSLIGGMMKRVHTARWKSTVDWGVGLRALLDAGGSGSAEVDRTLRNERDALERSFAAEFPSQQGSVLPTELGNVIRSFEDYPRRQYGMSAIPLWPRLVAVIDPQYATSVDDVKSSFDFMINVSFLSGVSAGGLLLLGLGARLGWEGPTPGLAWGAQLAGLALACFVFYRGSIAQAQAWGDMVRGAFDLYRGKLLSQLGFQQQPTDLLQERKLWRAISLQMIYGDPKVNSTAPLLRFVDNGTYAEGVPARAELRVSRSTQQVADGWQTCLSVQNPEEHPVADVRLTDTLADGDRYVWSSALSEGQPLSVSGTNPIRIEVGTLAPGEQRIIVYRTTQ